jgi:hypothetical protein
MAQEQTVTIRYLVFCGKHTPDGSMRSFNYREQAPASLCVPHVDDGLKPDADANGIFISSIVNRHNDEILLSQAWRCVTCDKPATEILHSAAPLLSPSPRSQTEQLQTLNRRLWKMLRQSACQVERAIVLQRRLCAS